MIEFFLHRESTLLQFALAAGDPWSLIKHGHTYIHKYILGISLSFVGKELYTQLF